MLARCANELAKRNPIFGGVLDMMDTKVADWLLPKVPVGEIWGIGKRTETKLHGLGVSSAADLRDMPQRQARAMGTCLWVRWFSNAPSWNFRENLVLRSSLTIDDVEPRRKGMAVTRSSGTPMTDFDTLFEAITAHTTRPYDQGIREAPPARSRRRCDHRVFPYQSAQARSAAICGLAQRASGPDVQ